MGTPTSTMPSGFRKNFKGGPHWETTPPEISKLVNKMGGYLQLVKDGIRWAAPILIVLMMNEVLWMVTILAKDGILLLLLTCCPCYQKFSFKTLSVHSNLGLWSPGCHISSQPRPPAERRDFLQVFNRYCYKVRTLMEFDVMGFWAKSRVEWVQCTDSGYPSRCYDY